MTEAMAFGATTISARIKTAATVVTLQMMLACAAMVGSRSPLGGTDEGIGGIGPSWLRAWTSYDANWYVAIANEGYRQAPTTAFFPLLPALMRLISPVLELVFGLDQRTGLAVAGMIVSISAFVGALCCIHAEVRDTVGSVIADRTVIGLTLVPFALTWQTIYTESLTLLGLALLVRFVRQDRLTPAVLAGLLLGATRSVGVPIGLGLITAHAAVPFVRRRTVHWTATWSGVAATSASLVVLGLLGRLGGGVAAQVQFGRARSLPWVPIWRDLSGVGGYSIGSITSLAAIGLGACYVAARKEPIAWRIAVGTLLIMHLTMARQVPAFTIGAARYLMPIYPITVWLARLTRSLSRPVLLSIACVLGSIAVGCAFGAGQGAFNIG